MYQKLQTLSGELHIPVKWDTNPLEVGQPENLRIGKIYSPR